MMNEWTEWNGVGAHPSHGTLLQIKLRDGSTNCVEDYGLLEWGHADSPTDIVAYRRISEEELNDFMAKAKSALDVQIAGNHYQSKRIQPVSYIHANGLNFLEGCIVKRITRWRDKPAESRFQDLEKIKHEVDLLIEMETRYGGQK